jgi:hypothetical protein
MKARRIILWVAVMGVAAATWLLVDPLRGGLPLRVQAASNPTQTADGGLDLSAPVTAGSCAPCHQRIAEGRKPGIIFTHATHLSFQCVACHPANPHLGGTTATPPMELCFNCHGVQHGPQGELATGQCRQCHTAGFELKPGSHTADWAGKPHAVRGKAGGVNSCMMCHRDPVKQCDECHKAKGVKVGPMPKVYHPLYRQQPRKPAVTVYPDKPTTMGQCIQCHPDIDSFMPGRVIFQHADLVDGHESVG